MRKKKKLIKPLLCALVAFSLLAAYIAYDTNRVVVVHESLSFKDLPPEFDGYRILQISDLHAKMFGDHQSRLAEKLKGEKVDLIALTGDYISRQDPTNIQNKTATMDLIAHLKELFPNVPIYFVIGNTDVFDEVSLIDDMVTAGAIPLFGAEDHPYRIEKNGSSFWIGTIGYSEQQLRNYPIRDNDFYLALHHYPTGIEVEKRQAEFDRTYEVASKQDPTLVKQVFINFDLLLAGHTHGGQIRLPFIGAVYAPTGHVDEGLFPDLFPKYQKGTYVVNNRTLYISSGLGAVGNNPLLRFRFNNPPEMNIIELQKA